MTQINPAVDARYHPVEQRTIEQLLLREIEDNLAIGYHTEALYELGSFYFEKAGFASIPRLSVTIVCKERDYLTLQPMLRRMFASHIGSLGWTSNNLAAYPSMGRGKTRKFRDQHGANRMGMEHRVSFELSPELTEAIDWTGYMHSRGTVKYREWEQPAKD